MEQKSLCQGKKSGWNCYVRFTGYFCIVLCAVLFFFIKYRKSMVWDCDGLYQHFNSLVYYGKYLRGILRNLWENHTLSVPMWDMSIGYGSDILTTMNYYCFGDPLALTSVFVPAEYTEYLYGFLAVLRLYLAGCSFLVYCRYHQNGDQASVLGALTYAFSGFALYVFARHPFFMNPMMYFPLLLTGIDKIFDRKKPWLFIWITAILAISNFYFCYMACILMFLYAVVSYIKRFGKIHAKELAGWFFKFVGYFLVAMCIAAVTLLPSAMFVLETGRMNANFYIPWLYDPSRYVNYLVDFLHVAYGAQRNQSYGIFGMAPLVVIALMVLFLKRKRFTHLKVGFLILTVCFLTPFCGHVLNGFSYASNRWTWGFILLLSYILVKIYPELFTLERKERLRLLAMAALYLVAVLGILCLMAIFAPVESPAEGMALILPMMAILCAGIVLSGRPKVKKALPAFFYTMTIAGLVLNALILYAPGIAGNLEVYRPQGKPYAMLTSKSECYPVKELGDDSGFYRYDQYGIVSHENTAMQNRLNGTDYYFSVSNRAVSRFFADLYVSARCDYMYDNLDGRTMLDRLASVKYFVIRKGEREYLPYSYDERVGGSKKFKVFKSDEALPFGYTYKYAVSRDTFEALPVEQRQQTLMQGAVTEESSLPEAELAFCENRPDITFTPDEHITADGTQFTVSQGGSELKISFEGQPDCETYVVMRNLQYEGSVRSLTLNLSMGEVSKRTYVFTNRHNFYCGYNDYLCNLGFSGQNTQEITLRFPVAGTYAFDELYVVCQPMDLVDAQTEALREDVLENVAFSDNRINGTISLDEPKMLVLSMAYSRGWSALVDGEAWELKQVNGMYPGLELPSGDHTVELRYETPFLRLGLMISAAGFAALCLLWLYFKLDTRRK